MKKEIIPPTRNGWKNQFEKISQVLNKAWKTANDFNLIEKAQKSQIFSRLKIWGTAALFSTYSITTKATPTEAKSSNRLSSDTEVKNNSKEENKKPIDITFAEAAHTDESDSEVKKAIKSEFKAYSGQYYNEICNGSPCWLASTYETNGAGLGNNPSSIATWNDRGNYRGINQISPAHAKKYLTWLEGKPEYKDIYETLKQGGLGKANWQKTAKQLEHPMTESFEWYMVEVYNPDNFKFIQDRLNKSGLKASVKKLHPAILSAMHQIMVEVPIRRNTIANKIVKFMETHSGDEKQLNSEEFIKTLISNKKIQGQAIKLLNDTSIIWKTAQFNTLVAQAVPTQDDGKSWFDLQQEERAKKELKTRREAIAKKAPGEARRLSDNHFKQVLDEMQISSSDMPRITNLEELRRARAKTSGSKKKVKSEKNNVLFNDRLLNRKKNAGKS